MMGFEIKRARVRGAAWTDWVAIAVAAALLAGCGSADLPPESQATGLSGLARLYGEFMSTHQDNPPENAAEFRAFLDRVPSAQRQALGLGDIAEGLTSPRDGLPYVFVYGSDVGTIRVKDSDIVVYEQAGTDGTRWAADALGVVHRLSDQEAQSLFAD